MGLSRGARIEIEKRIPVAGGLGGGSSNAACVLLGLGRLWGLDLPRAALVGLAGRLGSDVPFFLVGGTALGIGRGEEVYPIEEVTCDCLVLVNPGIPVSTAAVFERHSRLTRVEVVRKIPFTLVAASDIRGLPFAARNDLEEAAEAAYPEIAEVKRRLLGLGARRALMSGSGATVVGLFDNTEAGRQATDRLQADGYWSIIARAIDRREYHRTMFS
jgi:4-diphosphocytidyl-2-C-methyl-D-erythritol kinase